VIVRLRQPKREMTIEGAHTVNQLLDRLEMNRESFLVIRNGTLVPGDGRLEDTDTIEIRPVVSGG
jgi:sulfur carrier protein